MYQIWSNIHYFMEDLLKEEDFLHKPVKPWKWFMLFYIAGFITLPVFYTIMRYAVEKNPSEILIIVFVILMPVFYSFLMIFTKRDYFKIPNKTIALAILLMMACYALTILGIGLVANKLLEYEQPFTLLLSIIALYAVLALISMVIIIPIVRIKRKKTKFILN